jgi:hypothetical protein
LINMDLLKSFKRNCVSTTFFWIWVWDVVFYCCLCDVCL